MTKEEYERLKSIALEKIENLDISISHNFKDKSLDELMQISEIYQAELEAQNDELQTHISSLETAQNELEILFTHAPIAYLLMTNKFIVHRANDNVFKIFNASTVMSDKVPFYAYVYGGHLTKFLNWLNNSEKEYIPLEILLKTKNGYRYCSLNYFKWNKNDNDVFLLSITDIHAQKEESDRFKALFDNTQQGIFYIDQNKTIVDVNQTTLDIMGEEKETLLRPYKELNWTFLDVNDQFISSDDLPFAKVFKNKKKEEANIFAVYKETEQTKIWLKMEATPHFSSENEELLGVFCIFTDVSTEVALNQKMQYQLENFRTFGDHIPDIILRMDDKNNIIFANKKAYEFFEIEANQKDKIKLSDLSLFTTSQAKEFYKEVGDLSKLNHPVSYSINYKTNNSNKHYFIRIIPENSNEDGKYYLAVVEDITERIASEEMFNQLFFYASDAIILTDHNSGQIKSLNAKARKLLNINEEVSDYRFTDEVFTSFKSQEEKKSHAKALNDFGVDSYETTKKLHNGEIKYFKIYCTLINIGKDVFHQSIVHDLTEHKLLELQLQQTSKVFDHTIEGIIITDLQGVVVSVNESFTKITGYSKEEIIGKNPSILQSKKHDKNFYKKLWHDVTKKGIFKGEIWNKKKDGTVYPEWIAISTIYDEEGKPVQYVAVFSDFSEMKKTQNELENLAHYDTLTQLPNRLLLYEQIKQSIKVSNRNNNQFAVLFIDLDRFKQINDTHGHGVGDEVLKMTAQRLQNILRKSDIVSRLGGDEFIAVINEINDITSIHLIANTILAKLKEPFKIGGEDHYTSGSIGVSIYPNDTQDEDINTLLKHADIAMYESKAAGKNTYHIFSEKMAETVKTLSSLHNNLNVALSKNEFYLVYQPQYDIATQQILGFEALIRWKHPTEGEIMPDKFISYAEESKLIIPIGKWVIEQAIEDYYMIKNVLNTNFTIAVNVSQAQMNQEFINLLKDLSLKHDNFSKIVKIEITETAAMKNLKHAQSIIEQIKSLGFKISLDDFGTGYSALSAIKSLHIDELKIDKSFVQDVPGDIGDEELVSTIIAMAKVMKKALIAEGVETKETQDFLVERSCSVIQGYLIAKPMRIEDILVFLDKK